MWKIDISLAKSRVIIVFEGEYERNHDAFDQQLEDAAIRVLNNDREFDCLVDMRKTVVAPQEQAARGGGAIHWCLANGLRKGAVVTPSITHRMQMRRLAQGNERLGYFASLDEAEQWLCR